MKLKRFEPFKNNKPLRYSLAALVAVALFLVIYGDRTGWWRKTLGEIKAETAIECPQLEKGCTFRIKDKQYTVKSDMQPEAGKPFTLEVNGIAAGIKVFWHLSGTNVAQNSHKLDVVAKNQWQAKVTLPPSANGNTQWRLHLEVNSRAADIHTEIHNTQTTARMEK